TEIEWRSCDLFSLLDAEKALQGVDVAIYLVHSMRPSAHLTQGTFEDFDLIVADNFARAAKNAQVKQIIYLGGMKPQGQNISKHLQSRSEVETVFRKSGVTSTVLRAAVILGADGSSFHIMVRLVDRLPLMICPAWTSTLSQPVALRDIVAGIIYCIGNESTFGHTFDVGGPQAVSYKEMMLKIAEIKKLKRHVVGFPLLTPQLSTLWVCLITGAPRALVKPLVMGLLEPLLVNPENALNIPGYAFMNINSALTEALRNYDSQKSPLAFKSSPSAPKVVRSVQRLAVPPGTTAEKVAQAYLNFLTQLPPKFLKVKIDGNWITFCWRFPTVSLLTLEYTPGRSWPSRQLFYVRGGFLAKKNTRGRLEFREITGGNAVLAAVHDFAPTLPWYLYKFTQAILHVWIMKKFAKYLNLKKNQDL
ncbi:MAG: NAD(P)H-binding protein, partial [Bdellovibrio sp.]